MLARGFAAGARLDRRREYGAPLWCSTLRVSTTDRGAMLIRRAADIRSSEITDERLYVRRREFLQACGLAAVGVAAGGIELDAQSGARPPRLSNVAPGPFGTTEAKTPYETITTYNNFYEFGTDKASPAQLRGHAEAAAVDGAGGRRVRPPGRLRPRRPAEAARARGARLPDALRRRLVDGDSVGRHSARRRAQAVRADLRARSSSSSRRSTTPGRCRASATPCSTGRTSKGCASTRRCTR